MKLTLVTVLIFLSLRIMAQQRAATFQTAAKDGLTVQVLNKQYANALDNDNSKSVFKGDDRKKFYKAYVSLLTDLNNYLHTNNFTWGKPTRIVHRIYFEPDGKIDHYLLNLDATDIDRTRQARFLQLLNQFIKNYKFKLTSDKKYAQCGPAIYQD